MTQRERILALGVGGLLLAVVLNWGFGKYRTETKLLKGRLDGLRNEQTLLDERITQGYLAERQMTEYTLRSLPSDAEVARSKYQKWLADTLKENGLASPSVDPMRSTPVGDLYEYHSYSVKGSTDLEGVVDLLHAFYAKDYLHRIREFSLAPDRTGALVLQMTVDAAALGSALPDAPEPTGKSFRLTESLDDYKSAILNRNLFRPPNGGPKFVGKTEIEAIVGQESRSQVSFQDPEGDRIRYEWVDGPDDVATLDESSGSLRIKSEETGEFKIQVRATDSGYPARSSEQTLVIKVNDPPPKSEPPKPKPKFDDATQTVLTALVFGGNNEWTAWLNVRTRGKTLKLRTGDSFEVGTVNAKVIEVTAERVTFEVDDLRMDMRLDEKLSEVVARSLED